MFRFLRAPGILEITAISLGILFLFVCPATSFPAVKPEAVSTCSPSSGDKKMRLQFNPYGFTITSD